MIWYVSKSVGPRQSSGKPLQFESGLIPMTSKRRWSKIGVIAAFAAVILGPGTIQAVFQDDSTAAIRKVLDRQERDWNDGNLDAFLQGYWNSPKVVFQSGGDRNVGFKGMRDRYF